MAKNFGVAKYQQMVLDALFIKTVFSHEQAVKTFKEMGFVAEGKKANGQVYPVIYLLPSKETFVTKDEHGNSREMTSTIRYKHCNFNLIKQWVVNPDEIQNR